MYKKGDIVKLKDYHNFTTRKGELAQIEDIIGEDSVIRWFKDSITSPMKIDNLEIMKQYKLNKVKDKIEVGDLIVTNGDGSKILDKFIYGEVGEIGKKDERKCFYLWNNSKEGSRGNIARPSKWRFSWLIFLDNKKAFVIFVKDKMKEEKSILKAGGQICNDCGCEFDKKTMKEFDGDYYCYECFKNGFTECVECGDIVERNDDYIHKDLQYCEDCYNEHIQMCNGCEESFHEDELVWSERAEEYYCNRCYDYRFCHCNSCNTEMYSDDDDRRTGSDDETYCSDCWSERFSCCDSCGNVHRHDDLRTDDDGEHYYCEDCYEGDSDCDDGEEHHHRRRERVIHDYGYKPNPDFKKMNWDTNLFMGLELEVQHEGRENEVAEKLVNFLREEKIDNLFYLKHDGSVPKGFEIVTHPFTLAYAHKEMRLNKILKWMQENKFMSEESGECGLHIHLSRDFFEDLDVTKLRLFFKENEKHLKTFSGRKGKGENYCMFEQMPRKDIIKDVPQSGRYWALNLNSSTNTVEIRMFRGTLDKKRLTAILQFAEAISNFVKEIGITSLFLGEREYRGNSWKLFLDWAKDTRKYGLMLNYMKGEKLCV